MSPLSTFWQRLTYRLYGERSGAGKPVPADALDHEYASGAWDHFYSDDERQRFDALIRIVTAHPVPPSLLELGCGSGRLLSLLEPGRVSRYLGVDLSVEGLKRARALAHPQGHFEQADFETWRPNEPWDLIVFNESIGYARDPASTAKAFANHLTPGGQMIISHFRFGNTPAQWARIEKYFEVEKAEEVHNDRGQIWDLKVLRPR
jgi:SAM-dependent methyltransferase